MYTPGRIYRPVFQPPCGGNGFRNAADTARPVLITIHTYCPHILPISPRTLPLATDYITTYGEHKLLWLPFYRRPSTSSSSSSTSSFSTDHLSRATHLTTACLFLSPSPTHPHSLSLFSSLFPTFPSPRPHSIEFYPSFPFVIYLSPRSVSSSTELITFSLFVRCSPSIQTVVPIVTIKNFPERMLSKSWFDNLVIADRRGNLAALYYNL